MKFESVHECLQKSWRIGIGGFLLLICTHGQVHATTPRLILQDTITLPVTVINGVELAELSALAWDEDEQLLYAVSDKGNLFHLQVELTGSRIKRVETVWGGELYNREGERLKPKRRDAEGLTLINDHNGKRGDSQLVISLEGEPRIVRFTAEGRAIQNITLPAILRNVRSYRHPNNGLEAVTFHPRYGFITAPELPLKGYPRDLHKVYSTQGHQWAFLAYPAKNSGICALETLPDGNLLILERAWSGFPNPLVVSLRYLDFKQCSREGVCSVQDLQVISSYLFIDNYEGIAHIGGNRYLMVSDNGGSGFLRTALTLFTLDMD